jgi:hypothetical protein
VNASLYFVDGKLSVQKNKNPGSLQYEIPAFSAAMALQMIRKGMLSSSNVIFHEQSGEVVLCGKIPQFIDVLGNLLAGEDFEGRRGWCGTGNADTKLLTFLSKDLTVRGRKLKDVEVLLRFPPAGSLRTKTRVVFTGLILWDHVTKVYDEQTQSEKFIRRPLWQVC